MLTINITAHPQNVSQIEAVKAFMKALKIKFELTKQEDADTSVFIADIQSSLNQVQQMRTGKLPKQSAKDFLNEL